MRTTLWVTALLVFWAVVYFALQLSFGAVLRLVGIFFVAAMLFVICRSEMARRSIERDREEHLASERQFGRDSRRNRGD